MNASLGSEADARLNSISRANQPNTASNLGSCDAKSSYSYNMQVYTGKPAVTQHERNLGKCVVLEMLRDLEVHIVTCDNFSQAQSSYSEN